MKKQKNTYFYFNVNGIVHFLTFLGLGGYLLAMKDLSTVEAVVTSIGGVICIGLALAQFSVDIKNNETPIQKTNIKLPPPTSSQKERTLIEMNEEFIKQRKKEPRE